MSTLIKNIFIADPESPYYKKRLDVFIEKNIIKKIGKSLSDRASKVIDGKQSFLSPGWVDVMADYREPGEEFKETIGTGLNAAQAGGFSDVIVVPNTQPAITNASMLDFLQKKSAGHRVRLHVLGAVSKNIEGKELAEMLDMHHAGAIGYSDGWQPLQNALLMLKALEYVKTFDGLIVQIPIETALSGSGLMNESATSVQLGMNSTPSIAESVMVYRDLKLLEYTKSKLHISGVTTEESVNLIRDAKAKGLQVSCSVTPYHLLFDDTVLENYDSNFKVNPPLRTGKDRQALIKALKSGVIDCIATHHRPQDWDAKNKEFAYAGWGMATQETCWPMLHKAIPKMTPEEWVRILSLQPGKIFGIKNVVISEGQPARLTIFNDNEKWLYGQKSKKTKSINNPWLEQELTGRAYSI